MICHLKIFYFWLWQPFCSAEGNHLAILVKGHLGNISVKLFWNRAIGLGGEFI